MQLPAGIHDCYRHQSKVLVTLKCSDTTHDVDSFRYNEPQEERSWEVVYLPRPSGAGLSGGWAGFAKDQVGVAG